MGARILDLNGAEVQEDRRPSTVSRSACNVEDLQATYLLSAVNERGQRCWFYRVAITGLYTRMYGPFTRKSDAIEGFEQFLERALHVLCDCLNDATGADKCGMEFIQAPQYLNEKGRSS